MSNVSILLKRMEWQRPLIFLKDVRVSFKVPFRQSQLC